MTRPTPTRLRILAGNPGKRPLPENEPEPTVLVQPPAPPKHLRKEARKTWNQLADRLTRLGILTENDLEILENICVYRQMFIHAAREGKTLCAADMTQYRVNCEAFGMSPASRTRVKVIGGKKDSKEAHLFGAA